MTLKETIRPITYLKTNTADVMSTVVDSRTPVIITHNGEPKMVVQDAKSYQELKQSLSMLKLVAMSKKQIDEGKTRSAADVFKALEKKLKNA